MCGIAGFYQSGFNYLKDDIWQKRLVKMKESITHRGPDDNDIYLSKHIGLAHTRLSIIDLKSGHQPMQACYNGHRGTICYNGEIYNYKKLKAVLISRGANFNTDSDTEVILMGYLMYGTSFFQSLNGIFAFAIYDEATDELIIARDHLGVKPLFYQEMATSFVFGSEPKALFAYGILPRLNQDSFKEVLGLGPAKTPGNGIYVNMKELLGGSYIIVKPSASGSCYTTKTQFFWKLTAKEVTDSYNEAIYKTSFLINDSIKQQMISDIPICTFLSGGLDSSLVSAICAKNLSYEDKILSTFSFDFVNNHINFKANSFQASEDRPFVDIMKNHIKSNHYYLECNNEIQADYLLKAVDARDFPCMSDVESSLLYFCSLVSKQIKVALTGECADEIFGGYPWFHNQSLMDKGNFPWSYDFDARCAFLKDEIISVLDLESYSRDAYITTINATPLLTSDTLEDTYYKKVTYLNVQWFMQTLLSRMDRTSMYSGLEARVPFADYRILEYVYNLPWEYRCHNNIHKSLLVETGKSLLPNEVLFRKKSPYPKTYDPAYEQLLANRLRDILADKNSPLYDLIDAKKVNTFLDAPKDYGKPWYGQLMAGPQMIGYFIQLDYWLRKCHYTLD